MRSLIALVLLTYACGGPTQNQLVESPSATTFPRQAEAPPASGNDLDRDRLIQSFDDMQTTQQSYRESGQGNLPLYISKPTPKKKGPAVQAKPEALTPAPAAAPMPATTTANK